MDSNVKLIIALLAGAVLGGAAMTQSNAIGGGDEKIKEIVRQVIKDEPRLILDSVNNMQQTEQKEKMAKAQDALKDESLKLAIFNNVSVPFVGRADSKKTVVEFFDYNCPACKAQFKVIDELHKKDGEVKILFKEYPIFGPQSDTNSKIGLAVQKLDPSKYYAFHTKMMTHEGRADEATALGFVKEIGLDPAAVKAEIVKPEYEETLQANRAIGDKLHIQGTPTIVIGDEVVPHMVAMPEFVEKLGKIKN